MRTYSCREKQPKYGCANNHTEHLNHRISKGFPGYTERSRLFEKVKAVSDDRENTGLTIRQTQLTEMRATRRIDCRFWSCKVDFRTLSTGLERMQCFGHSQILSCKQVFFFQQSRMVKVNIQLPKLMDNAYARWNVGVLNTKECK